MSSSSRNRVAAGQRVTHRRRCPICGHDSHCFFTDDGQSVWCMRVSSGAHRRDIKFADGRIGSLHRLNGQAAAAPVKRDAPMPTLAAAELENFAKRFETAVPPARLDALATKLGVTVTSLRALRIGWADRDTLVHAGTTCRSEGCWSFPMTDGAGRVVGIRLRTPDGFKYAMTGGSSGVFVPAAVEKANDVVVPEGPTDAAALIDLAFTPVGRPDCQGGTPAIVAAVKRLQASRVVLMLDNDPEANPQARRAVQLGMTHTRAALSQICRVVVVHPPDHKDVRAAVADGVSRRDVLRWIRAAEGDRRERAADQTNTRRRSA